MATNNSIEITSFKAVLKDGRIVTVDLKLSGDDIKIGDKTLVQALGDAHITWEIID